MSGRDAARGLGRLQAGTLTDDCAIEGVRALPETRLLRSQNYPLLTEDVVIALHTRDAQLKHVNLSEAFRQGYVFQVTTERLVFRTAYGQPDSIATEVPVR